MRTIEFTLPEKTILLNQWQRLHWSKRRQHAKRLAFLVLSSLFKSGIRRPKEPLHRCHVEIVRGSSQLPDWDGLYGGLKPLLDSFVKPSQRNPHGLGLIEDDNPSCLLSLTARAEKTRRGEEYTRVFIGEVVE